MMMCLRACGGVLCLLLMGADASAAAPSAAEYQRFASEVEQNLQRQVLDKWFPAAVDRKGGGFFENFNEDWSPGKAGEKSIVYQARMTWLAAQAARRFPDRAAEYQAIAPHGLECLADKLWDKEKGGFYWAVDDSGRPTRERGDEKHAYGISFGIYAAAGSYAVTKDPAALHLAQRAFRWLDEHAHDRVHGGYYEALTREGRPILDRPAPQSDAIGTRYGRKSMNTHIHLLESFVALDSVWPDPLVHERLKELHEVVLGKIYAPPGALHMFLLPDWTPVPGPDSFGHDIETAYLLVESAEQLGMPDDARTWTAARRLVDHALEVGFDHDLGGFYDEGTVDGKDLRKQKIWWVEAEGLNALLLMHERYGNQTPRYWESFEKQWAFISKYQIDHVHGGWYNTVNPDGSPQPGRAKSDRWTEGYHQGRAMLTVSARLRHLANEQAGEKRKK